MGVKGLSKFLAQYSKPITFNDLQGKKIAIDTSIFLYKFKYNTINNEFLTRFYFQIKNFKKHSITPLYVFDGECPPEKKETQLKRHEQKEKSSEKNRIYITKDDITNLKKLLRYLNVKYICPCNAEGEQYCSYLNKTDPTIYGVMSNDFDSFAFGCKKLITFKNDLKEYDIEEILVDLNVNLDTFIDICIASGTDYYQQGIPRMGITTSLKKIKIEPDICKWKGVPEDLNIYRIREIFKTDPSTKEDPSYSIEEEEDLSSFIQKLNLKITLKNGF